MPKLTVIACDNCGAQFPDDSSQRPKFEDAKYLGMQASKETSHYLCIGCAMVMTVHDFFRLIVVPQSRARATKEVYKQAHGIANIRGDRNFE